MKVRVLKKASVVNFFLANFILFSSQSYARDGGGVREEFYSTFTRVLVPGKVNSNPTQEKRVKIKWQANNYKSSKSTLLQLSDFNSGVWTLFPSSSLDILDREEDVLENPFLRHVYLNSGDLRFRASGGLNEISKDEANYKITIQTPELKVFVSPGSDLLISRKQVSGETKFISTLTVLNGFVLVLSQDQNDFSDSILVVAGNQVASDTIEEGKIDNLDLSYAKDLIQKSTTVTEKKVKDDYSQNLPIEDLVKRCFFIESRYGYQEIFQLFQAERKEFANNPDVNYCLGVANEGYHKNEQAIKHLKLSIDLKPQNKEAIWHLAKNYLELKQYQDAKKQFEIFHGMVTEEDPRFYQDFYYHGVISFFQEEYLLAKEKFQDFIWIPDINPALRESAYDFLSKITVAKPWSVLIPLGITYDDNVLGLARNQSLPEMFTSKNGWKDMYGLIGGYDASLPSQNDGLFFGAEAKAIGIHNITKTYKIFDANVFEGSLFETVRWGNHEDTRALKFYQTAGLIYLNHLKNSFYLIGGVKYDLFDINAGYSFDIKDELPPEYKSSAYVFNQFYNNDNLLPLGKGVVSFNLQLQEKIPNIHEYYSANSIEIFATPAYYYPITQKFNASFSNTIDYYRTGTDPISTYIKLSPTLSCSYMINRWLLTSASLIYEYTRMQPDNLIVDKPQASFSLTGIL